MCVYIHVQMDYIQKENIFNALKFSDQAAKLLIKTNQKQL